MCGRHPGGLPRYAPQGGAVPFVESGNVMNPWCYWECSLLPTFMSPVHLPMTSCSLSTSHWKYKLHWLLTWAATLLGSPSEQTPCCSVALPLLLASQATTTISPRPHMRPFSWWWTGGLACCSPWGCQDSDTTERLNWTDAIGVCVLSRVWLFAAPWTVARQAPLSMGFPQPE